MRLAVLPLKTILHLLLRISILKGILDLDGWEALQYTRMRKDPEGDYGRQRRQRVTEILANELVSLSSVMRIQDLLTIIGENGETDLTFSQMSQLSPNINRHSLLSNLTKWRVLGSLAMALEVNTVSLIKKCRLKNNKRRVSV